MLDGRWVKIIWHPDDIEQARVLGVDVDGLDLIELPDGRIFPFQGFGPEDAKPPPLPGSKLAQLEEEIQRRGKREAPSVAFEVPVRQGSEATGPAPVSGHEAKDENDWPMS